VKRSPLKCDNQEFRSAPGREQRGFTARARVGDKKPVTDWMPVGVWHRTWRGGMILPVTLVHAKFSLKTSSTK
jgi:hypothetical protein